MRRFEASSCKAAPKGHTFISHAAPLRTELHQPLPCVLDTTANGHEEACCSLRGPRPDVASSENTVGGDEVSAEQLDTLRVLEGKARHTWCFTTVLYDVGTIAQTSLISPGI